MAFLQTRLCDSTKFQAVSLKTGSLKASLLKCGLLKSDFLRSGSLGIRPLGSRSLGANFLKSDSGFLTLTLLSLLSLMFLILLGFSLLSVGIKNITQAQSYCLTELSQTQKKLGQKLQQLLKLNQKVRLLNTTRKGIDASIAAATASLVLIPKVPALQKSKEVVKLGQKSLIAAQKGILIQSQLIKKQQIRKLKSKLETLNVRWAMESSFYKKALAVEKEEIGAEAYIYKPVEEFKIKQKIKVSWNLPAFYPLKKDLSWIFSDSSFRNRNPSTKFLNFNSSRFNSFPISKLKLSHSVFFIKQSCAVTLEQRGEQWIYRLSH